MFVTAVIYDPATGRIESIYQGSDANLAALCQATGKVSLLIEEDDFTSDIDTTHLVIDGKLKPRNDA